MKELVNKPFSQFETVVINDGVDTEELERIPAEDSSDEVKSELDDDATTKKILLKKSYLPRRKELKLKIQRRILIIVVL